MIAVTHIRPDSSITLRVPKELTLDAHCRIQKRFHQEGQ